ncbi:MAG: glycosyltransferase family 2 protein [Bacteroidia bacterium]
MNKQPKQKNNMLISVCIPTYNGGKYLEACLQSVSQQTFTDFEIIICDDCSADNTLEIVKAFQQKDTRIKLSINQKNLGLVGNWNRCLELAQGEWIKFVFQDDLITPTCLQKMLGLATDKTQMVLCEREFIFESEVANDIKLEYTNNVLRMYKAIGKEGVQHLSPQKACDLINKYVPANFFGEPTSVLFRKSVINEIGIFNPTINQHCDLEYWLRLASAYGFEYTSEKLVSFRIHNSSTTQKNNAEKYFSIFYVERIVLIYLLLFNPIYKSYRKHSSLFGLFNLRYTLFYVIYHANVYAKKNGTTIQNEMELLKEKYPKVKELQNQYFFYAPLNIAIRPFRRFFAYLKNKKKI